MTNPSTAAPARFYEWTYWRELAEFYGSEDQLEWTNDPDKMDLDDLYFVPGSNCLATELGINGLGPMLKSLLVEPVYILKDKEGFYYMMDIEETTPLGRFQSGSRRRRPWSCKLELLYIRDATQRCCGLC